MVLLYTPPCCARPPDYIEPPGLHTPSGHPTRFISESNCRRPHTIHLDRSNTGFLFSPKNHHNHHHPPLWDMMINSCGVEEKVAAWLRSGDLFGYLIDKAYLVYGADCECYIDRSWGDSAGCWKFKYIHKYILRRDSRFACVPSFGHNTSASLLQSIFRQIIHSH